LQLVIFFAAGLAAEAGPAVATMPSTEAATNKIATRRMFPPGCVECSPEP
jgi:hypothetical protein